MILLDASSMGWSPSLACGQLEVTTMELQAGAAH